jgi:hypothetical protein
MRLGVHAWRLAARAAWSCASVHGTSGIILHTTLEQQWQSVRRVQRNQSTDCETWEMSVDLKCLEMYWIDSPYICPLGDTFGHGVMACVCSASLLILLVLSNHTSVQCGVLSWIRPHSRHTCD